MDLPPVLGRAIRDPVVLLVTGRTAVARIGGMTAIARHVATASRLGLEPVVLYPQEMKALGAEIGGQVGERTTCIASDAFNSEAGPDHSLVLVIAADWYIAPRAIIEFGSDTEGCAAARFKDRGRAVAPMARMTVAALRAIIPELATNPSGELILKAAGGAAVGFELPVSERHRLSDNVAVERAENKLLAGLGPRSEPWPLRAVQAGLSLPLARQLARAGTAPMAVALAKVALGLAAAWALVPASYTSMLAGAILYFTSRLLDGTASELARAGARDSSRAEQLELLGDSAVMVAIVFSLAATTALGPLLASVAAAGVAVSAYLSWSRMLAPLWAARRAGRLAHMAPGRFAAGLASRDGAAYALLVTALLGRTDLFLWAAAPAWHLYYLLWLLPARREPDDGSIL